MIRVQVLLALCSLCLVTVSSAWVPPPFCHNTDCPQFTLIQTHEGGFEVRHYEPSDWLTVELAEFDMEEGKAALWKLHHYIKGDNEEQQELTLPWPSILLVDNSSENKLTSVNWPVPSGTYLPKPTDGTIKETHLPAATVYVRVFDGYPSMDDLVEEVNKLKECVTAAGLTFVANKFVAGAYDPPLKLFGRHNEVWIFKD